MSEKVKIEYKRYNYVTFECLPENNVFFNSEKPIEFSVSCTDDDSYKELNFNISIEDGKNMVIALIEIIKEAEEKVGG